MKAPHSLVHPNHKGGVFHVVFFSSASKGLNAKETCKKKQKNNTGLKCSLKDSETQKEWRYGGEHGGKGRVALINELQESIVQHPVLNSAA